MSTSSGPPTNSTPISAQSLSHSQYLRSPRADLRMSHDASRLAQSRSAQSLHLIQLDSAQTHLSCAVSLNARYLFSHAQWLPPNLRRSDECRHPSVTLPNTRRATRPQFFRACTRIRLNGSCRDRRLLLWEPVLGRHRSLWGSSCASLSVPILGLKKAFSLISLAGNFKIK